MKTINDNYYDVDLWQKKSETEYDPILFQYFKQEFDAAKNIKNFLREYCGMNIVRLEPINIPSNTYIFDLLSKLEICISEKDKVCISKKDFIYFHNLKWDLIRYMEKICKVMDQFNDIKYEETNSRLLAIENFIETYPEFLNSFELNNKYIKNLYDTLKEFHGYIKQQEANKGHVKTYQYFK